MSTPVELNDDPAFTTWASRNPDRPTQPAHIRSSKSTSRSDMSMGTCTLLKKNTKESLDLVQEAVSIYLADQDKFIGEMAERHLVDKDRIKKMITHSLTSTLTCLPSLTNAIFHHKAKELNEEIENDPEMDPSKMSKLRKKELINELAEHRALKLQGSHSSNHASAIDMHKNIKHITMEMKNLFLHTGVCSCAFFSRGHAKDTTTTFTVTLDDTVMRFFPEVLKLDYADVLAKFEMYACLENRTVIRVDTLPSMHAECTSHILHGLRSILFNKTVKMNYQNYNTVIVEKHHVHLIGWPSRIPFGSPSNISTVDDIRLLHLALTGGDCKWAFLTAEEWRTHDQKLAYVCSKGVVVGK
ncbi:hypothetical protein C0992_012915 [Termitomyces sp. T32_za158]|nr:hypothetical protein C0992_012915 [Termitomyces sp. T32_za158]